MLSQMVSDVRKTNYMNDSDKFLLDYFKTAEVGQSTPNTVHPQLVINAPNFNEKFVTFYSVRGDCSNFNLSLFDTNLLYYLAGSCIHNYLKNSICENFFEFINKDLILSDKFKMYTALCDKGGLKQPNVNTFDLMLNCEIIYKKYEQFVIHNNHLALMEKIVSDIDISFPSCDLCYAFKKFAVYYFFYIRSQAVVGLQKCKKKRDKVSMAQRALRKKRLCSSKKIKFIFLIIIYYT